MSEDKLELIAMLSSRTSEATSPRVQNPKGLLLLVPLLLLAVILALWFFSRRAPTSALDARENSPAQLSGTTSSKPQPLQSLPKRGPVKAGRMTAKGFIVATRALDVSSPVSGVVKRVNASLGDSVEKGAVIFELVDDDLQMELRIERAKRDALDSAIEGTVVEIDAAEVELNRYEDLVGQSYVSPLEIDTLRLKLAKLNARLASQQQDVTLADLLIEQKRASLSKYRVRAPFDGVVTASDVTVGEVISGGGQGALLTIVDTTSLEVIIEVREAQLGSVNVGQRGVAYLESAPDTAHNLRLGAMIPRADRNRGTIQFRGQFEKLNDAMLPGMSVTVVFDDGDPGNGKGLQ